MVDENGLPRSAGVMPTPNENAYAALSDADLQAILASAVKEYGRRSEDRDLPAFHSRSGVTPTDVMRTTTAMLQAVELQLFELGMWQAWTGKH